MTANGWFAARPSGTENIYKIYAESFTSQSHLDVIVAEARQIVAEALALGGKENGGSRQFSEAPVLRSEHHEPPRGQTSRPAPVP